MYPFTASIGLIGINPFVLLPPEILEQLFRDAGKQTSPIPVKGTINGRDFLQNLVRYKGEWRLYINTVMLANSTGRIGECIDVRIAYDPEERTIQPHPSLLKALNQHKEAKRVFSGLPPSLQKEIIRYISFLKTEDSITRNVEKAIGFLLGKNRFIGRDPDQIRKGFEKE